MGVGDQSEKKRRRINKFVKKHFPNATKENRGKGEEWVFLCPFCKGGTSGEVKFNLNPERGVCRCWRASCGWRSTVEWFVAHYLDVEFPRAVEIVNGEEATTEEGVIKDLQMVEDQIERDFKTSVYESDDDTVHAWVSGSTLFSRADDAFQYDVRRWLEKDRGYDPDDFLDTHDLYKPPETSHALNGRVLFKVQTGNSNGYLAYAYRDGLDRKTLNPPGSVLSKMLYNYDEAKKNDRMFVCEGVFDAARLMEYGLPAVCTFGVNVSETQESLMLDANLDELCFVFDHGAEEMAHEMAQQISHQDPDLIGSVLTFDEELVDNFEPKMDPDDASFADIKRMFKRRHMYKQDRNTRLNYVLKQAEQKLSS